MVALVGIALTHISELGDKLEESGMLYQGVLFIALIAGCVLLVALARWVPERPWWTGVLAVSVPPFIAFILSRTVGLPHGEDDIGAWDAVGIASLVFEAVAAGLAIRALQRETTPARRERVPMRRPQPIRDF